MLKRLAAAIAALAAFSAPAVAQSPSPPSDPQTAQEQREAVRRVFRNLQRIVAKEGVEEERYVTLGGVRQWINLRGHDRRAPILLFLHGGPGDPVSGIAYAYQRPWEDFFTVVNWDQRGFGRSAGTEADAARLKGTVDTKHTVADAIALIEMLRKEFGQPKIILVGQSYGTVLALKIARERPDLLYAVVTQGLAANWLKSVDLVRERLIADAQARGDVAKVQHLRDLGPVPDPKDPEAVLAYGRRFDIPIPDEHTWRNIRGEGDGWGFREETLKAVSPDLSADDYAAQKGSFAAHPERYREAMTSVLAWDAARDVGVRFDVPLIVMQGAFDWQTDRDLAKAYFDRVCAPWKKWVEFPEAAHALNIEQPGLSVVTLVNDVAPAVHGRRPPGALVCRAGRRR